MLLGMISVDQLHAIIPEKPFGDGLINIVSCIAFKLRVSYFILLIWIIYSWDSVVLELMRFLNLRIKKNRKKKPVRIVYFDFVCIVIHLDYKYLP